MKKPFFTAALEQLPSTQYPQKTMDLFAFLAHQLVDLLHPLDATATVRRLPTGLHVVETTLPFEIRFHRMNAGRWWQMIRDLEQRCQQTHKIPMLAIDHNTTVYALLPFAALLGLLKITDEMYALLERHPVTPQGATDDATGKKISED